MIPKRNFITLLLLLTACDELLLESIDEQPVAEAPATTNADWYNIYFSEPGSATAEAQRGGPDAYLVQAIDNARVTVDAALYDLNLWSVRNALLDAHRRGVEVRVVVESDYLDEPEIEALIDAGITVVDDRNQGLMHNKFIIIDRYQVWTGSMNMTLNGAYHNNNNLVQIFSEHLTENYLVEFEEMFIDYLFGESARSDTPYPTLTVEGTAIEVFFSPDDGVQAHLVDLINQAQESVYVLAFAFTADALTEALIDADQRGVTVAGVIESRQAENTGSDYETLVDAGLDFVLDGNPKNMHHKVIIIDGAIVVTGSYNFSRSAEERNDENTLIFYNETIAALYLAEFDRIK